MKRLRIGIFFNKRGGATKPSLSLRGAGFRAYERRTVARVPRGGGVGGGARDASALQQPRPQDDTAVDLLEAHNNAIKRGAASSPSSFCAWCAFYPDSCDDTGSRRLLNLEKFDLLGTALFAYVGTIAGGKNGMDVFGCMVIGTVTATGGGTLRDIVLGGEQQVFWMRDVTYLKICIVTSLVTFFTWPRFETKRGWRGRPRAPVFCGRFGNGRVFCVMGAEKALVKDVDPLCAAIPSRVSYSHVWRGDTRCPHETSRKDLPRND